MLDKEKILNFILENTKETKKHTFSKWEKEIFFMIDNNAKQKTILEYIFQEDETLQNRYKDRVPTAKALLAKFIKSRYKKKKSSLEEKGSINNNKGKVLKKDKSNLEPLNIKEQLSDDEKIVIKHIDGGQDLYTHKYLISECICNTSSSKKFDLIEKDIFVIPSVKNNIKFDFEKIKIDIKKGKYNLLDYQLIIHINIKKNSGLDVYRYLEGDLILIKEVMYHQADHLEDRLDKKVNEFIELMQ